MTASVKKAACEISADFLKPAVVIAEGNVADGDPVVQIDQRSVLLTTLVASTITFLYYLSMLLSMLHFLQHAAGLQSESGLDHQTPKAGYTHHRLQKGVSCRLNLPSHCSSMSQLYYCILY